jgi:hypothetical protein
LPFKGFDVPSPSAGRAVRRRAENSQWRPLAQPADGPAAAATVDGFCWR